MLNTLHALGQGFASALTLPHLAWAFVGITLGTAVGVLPGIGPAMTVASSSRSPSASIRSARSSCSPASTTAR